MPGTAPQQVREPLPSYLDGETRIGIDGVTYAFYKSFCQEIGEQPVRLSYSDGFLEIMITRSPHEFFKKMLAKLVEVTIFEQEIPVRSGGAMTFQRDDIEKGFEPDECWWIQHESLARTTTEFDFTKDPPPDLAIEIEISHSLAKRMEIYAALRVAEVWRFNGKKLRFLAFKGDQGYVDQISSVAFPFLSPENLTPYLKLPDHEDETSRVKRYVNWLRDHLKSRDKISGPI